MDDFSNNVRELLYRINTSSGELEYDLVYNAFKDALLSKNEARDTCLGSILTGITAKGPTRQEVIALVDASLSLDGYDPFDTNKIKIDIPSGEMLVGALGSGKKGIKTMNISTPAGIVAASAGLFFAKPGSSSTSSVTGSADFMDEIGANIDIPLEEMVDIIKDTRFGFFRIEGHIPIFDSIYGGKFHYPHALSFVLPALLSPVALDHLFYGLAHSNVELSARLLEWYRKSNFIVVSSTPDGTHFLDELGIYGTNRLIGKRKSQGCLGHVRYIQPTIEIGLKNYNARDISPGRDISQNVQYVIDVLAGKGTDARKDIVAMNAGLCLYIGEKANSMEDGYFLARKVIDEGVAIDKLKEFVISTGGNLNKLDKYMSNSLSKE